MDYCRQIIEDMNFNKKQFRSKLPIRLLAVGGEHSIPNMGESLQPYFENVASLVIAESGHFVPEEQPVALADRFDGVPSNAGHNEYGRNDFGNWICLSSVLATRAAHRSGGESGGFAV